MSYNQPSYDYGRPDGQVGPLPQNWGPPQYDSTRDQLHGMSGYSSPGYVFPETSRLPQPGPIGFGVQNSLLTDPLVTDAALQYGSRLMGTGRSVVDREIEKYIALSSLKYYFAVDTQYVLGKLKLLLFPFLHREWFLTYVQNLPLPPRSDINAPDLYIPTMAYITYVLVAGLVLGLQNRFSPEILGILASQALAWSIAELLFHLVSLYIANIDTKLKTLDLLAFSSYKYIGIIIATLASSIFGRGSYYIALTYCSLTFSFYLVRALKCHVLVIQDGTLNDGYSSPANTVNTPGMKRKMYFVLALAFSQPILMWWLSFHLLPPFN